MFIFADFHKMRHRKFLVLMLRMEAHIIVLNLRSTSESLNKLCAEHPSLNQMNTHIHLSNSPHFEDHCSSSSLSLLLNDLTSQHDKALMSDVTDSDAKGDAAHLCLPLCDLATEAAATYFLEGE